MGSKKDRRADSQPLPSDDDRTGDRRAGRDRRQFERVLIDLEVDYRGEDTFLFAYITDISAMGIFVRTNAPEASGTRLNLRFNPPGMEPIECEGLVIWINPYRPGDRENLNPGMGIKFVDLTYDQREQIKELVRTFAYLSSDREDAEDGDAEPEAEQADGQDTVLASPAAGDSDEVADDDAASDRLAPRYKA